MIIATSASKPSGAPDAEVSAKLCNPLTKDCIGEVVGGAIGETVGSVANTAQTAATGLVDGLLDSVAAQFTDAATGALQWLWAEIDTATSVDLTDAAIRQPMAYAVGVALVLTVALFVIQVMVSALRSDPGGLARAGKGLLVATIGAPAAVAVAQLLLSATDALCTGLVKATTEQDATGELGELILAGPLFGPLSGVVAILVSLLVLVSTVMVWASLMVRKVLILITAVFAVIAFAGAASDMTTKWVRQVCEVMIALIISKFVMVMIFSIGYNMLILPMAGEASGSGTAQASTLGAGILILLLAGLAPIAALKMVTFASGMGDQLRVGSNAMRGPAQMAAAVPQKAARAVVKTAAVAGTGGAGAGAAAGGAAAGGASAKAVGGSTGARAAGGMTQAGSSPAARSGSGSGSGGVVNRVDQAQTGLAAGAGANGTTPSVTGTASALAPQQPGASGPAPARAPGETPPARSSRPEASETGAPGAAAGPARSALPPTHTALKK